MEGKGEEAPRSWTSFQVELEWLLAKVESYFLTSSMKSSRRVQLLALGVTVSYSDELSILGEKHLMRAKKLRERI